MRSLQSKTILLTALGIILTIITAIVISSVSISNLGNDNSKQILSLLCETGQKNLNNYFEDVQNSVDAISENVSNRLKTQGIEHLDENIAYAEGMFNTLAKKTSGTLTYYYRINPEQATTEKGFWYVDEDEAEGEEDKGFEPHTVTAIEDYDPSDPGMVWYNVPKTEGKSVWISEPYKTANLDTHHVISYNAPIILEGLEQPFVGVIGIEVDYKLIAEQVGNIALFDGKGYAFLSNKQSKLLYHPNIDILKIIDSQTTSEKLEWPSVPDGVDSKDQQYGNDGVYIVSYEYEGVSKIGAWCELHDGTRLYVGIPVSVINASWQKMIVEIAITSGAILILFIILTILFTRHITKPLRKLTEAAEEINDGNYNVKVDYHGNDEIGVLSTTVNKLIDHLRGYISDLNSLAYVDALTEVRNKGAFDIFCRELQARIDDKNDRPEFAIGIFDSDDLKEINDEYGHEKGDVYLKNSCHLICRVFTRSPVFRIGGDEFAVILQNEDYYKRESLKRYFVEKSAEICAFANEPWEEICMAVGIAVYNSGEDKTVEDVIRHADQLMYENKHERKKKKEH